MTLGPRPHSFQLSSDAFATTRVYQGRGRTVEASSFDLVLAEFTARWERGESPRLEDYLGRLRPEQTTERVELIYREFCLAGWAGLEPAADDYLDRFPSQAEALGRLFRVDGALGSSGLGLWDAPAPPVVLPVAGDEIGPYRLIRVLGEGGFARVFLAEQSDLDDRLVVVKVSSRVTPEPALLARASHPNIVEVLWHGEADGGVLQIICMPFLGGASLSTVLAERRRPGHRPGSGRELLADLDRVGADGYLPPREGRPAREALSRLSYPRATAWVVARLAGALDFAYGRGVLHGDVKPSNVLLAADGTPMLLDFNLSVGWRPRGGPDAVPGETGGTLAYMAPERLRAVADPALATRPSAPDRHRADIYSLGVLLLEMLTGRAPELPAGGRLSLQELASYYVSSRGHGSEVMIRTARTPLPAGLRSILSRCLAADPADRYRQASELSEDLDRWLTDRPLAFAREPGWFPGLVRAARRRRRSLAALATGLACSAAVTTFFWYNAEVALRERAVLNDSRVFDGEGSDAFQFRRALTNSKVETNPARTAKRHLDRYGVLDPLNDWRRRDEFRKLPSPDREELEAWLLEQALRFAHALGQRPESPGDWARGLVALDQAAAGSAIGPLDEQARVLRLQLGRPDPPAGAGGPDPPRWVVEYLQGVAAELRDEGRDDGRDAAEAMERYRAVLALRPGSFWANYRAACVACKQKQYLSAVDHMKPCVERRPGNPALRFQYAGCLFMAGRDQEAIDQCNKAQSLNPDHAETYLTRSFLRIRLGQFLEFARDIDLYDVLTGHRRRGASEAPGFDLTSRPDGPGDDPDGVGPGPRAALAPDPDELRVRKQLVQELSGAGRDELALGQIERVLEGNPGDAFALYNRARQNEILRRPDAVQDYARFVRHPQVDDVVRVRPDAIWAFRKTATSLIQQGQLSQALETARAGVRLADRHEKSQAAAYFLLARVYALLAQADPELNRDALDSLGRAYHLAPQSIKVLYRREGAFDDLRAEYGLTPFEAR